MKKLFLDDERQPWDNTWVLVRTALEFRKYITDMYNETKKIPDWISFDHDLHHEHYAPKDKWDDPNWYNDQYKRFKHETGLDCANWLCQFCVEEGIELPNMHIHSKNPVGANNISYAIMNNAMFYYEEDVIINPNPFQMGPPITQ